MFFIRLTRILPLIAILVILALLVYCIAAALTSPPRAKELLVRIFTWITGVLSTVFGLFTLYSLFERNMPVFDLAVSFFITALIGLVAIRIANYVFLKHNPEYKRKPMKATTKRKWSF